MDFIEESFEAVKKEREDGMANRYILTFSMKGMTTNGVQRRVEGKSSTVAKKNAVTVWSEIKSEYHDRDPAFVSLEKVVPVKWQP